MFFIVKILFLGLKVEVKRKNIGQEVDIENIDRKVVAMTVKILRNMAAPTRVVPKRILVVVIVIVIVIANITAISIIIVIEVSTRIVVIIAIMELEVQAVAVVAILSRIDLIVLDTDQVGIRMERDQKVETRKKNRLSDGPNRSNYFTISSKIFVYRSLQ